MRGEHGVCVLSLRRSVCFWLSSSVCIWRDRLSEWQTIIGDVCCWCWWCCCVCRCCWYLVPVAWGYATYLYCSMLTLVAVCVVIVGKKWQSLDPLCHSYINLFWIGYHPHQYTHVRSQCVRIRTHTRTKTTIQLCNDSSCTVSASVCVCACDWISFALRVPFRTLSIRRWNFP